MMLDTRNAIDEPVRKHARHLATLYLIFGGFHACILPLALFFSLGPLIATGGRAWEYEPVREMFIASLIVLGLLVVIPFAAARALLKNRGWVQALVLVTATASSLMGLLVLISLIDDGMPGWVIPLVSYMGLSAYSFWLLYHKALSNNGKHPTPRHAASPDS